jgi:L-phenylalanine/L-methionine N-acetyltransferase
MIRNITDSDFEFIFKLYMHPSVNPFLLYEMMDKKAFKPIFDELLNQNIIYIFSENDLNIGMFKFIPLQHRNCHMAYLGGVAIDPSFSGSGFGSKMFADIIELGRKKSIKRIELSVATYNQKAIKLYEKHGFVKEGILRNYTFLISENRYIDEQMMAYLY